MVEIVKVWSDMLSFAEFETKEAIVEVEAVAETVVAAVETVLAPVEDVSWKLEKTFNMVPSLAEYISAAAAPASGPPDIDPA